MSEGVLSNHQLLVGDVAALLAELPIEEGKVRSRRLYRGDDITVMGLAMDAGTVLREHVAPVPILVHVIDGRIGFEVDGRRHDLSPGGMIHVSAREPHAVEAVVPTRFLLMLLGSAKAA